MLRFVIKISLLPPKVVIYCIVKLVYNDHPRNPKFVAVVKRCSLLRVRGHFMLLKKLKWRRRNGGRCRQVVVSSDLTVQYSRQIL